MALNIEGRVGQISKYCLLGPGQEGLHLLLYLIPTTCFTRQTTKAPRSQIPSLRSMSPTYIPEPALGWSSTGAVPVHGRQTKRAVNCYSAVLLSWTCFWQTLGANNNLGLLGRNYWRAVCSEGAVKCSGEAGWRIPSHLEPEVFTDNVLHAQHVVFIEIFQRKY